MFKETHIELLQIEENNLFPLVKFTVAKEYFMSTTVNITHSYKTLTKVFLVYTIGQGQSVSSVSKCVSSVFTMLLCWIT